MIFPFCDTKKGLYCYYIIQQFKSTFKPLLEITQEKCGKILTSFSLNGISMIKPTFLWGKSFILHKKEKIVNFIKLNEMLFANVFLLLCF